MMMNRIKTISCLILCTLATILFAQEPPEQAETTQGAVYILPIEGQIENALIYLIRRGLKEAADVHASALVLDMHTPGGRVDSTEVICDLLKTCDIPLYTLVQGNAISAGAIIALTTHKIYMTPGSKIGDAMPIVMGQTPGEAEREKIESYVDGVVRSNCEFSGRDKPLGTAMVRRNFEYKIGERVISPEGQILTLTNLEAEELLGDPPERLLSEGTVEDLAEMLVKEGLDKAEVVRLEVTDLERLARLIAAFAPMLMTIGIAAIYLEIQSPGLGIPGIVAAICLSLFFFGHHIAGLAGMEELLLFGLGVALILVEILILPGFGVAGILGIGFILSSFLTSMIEQMPGQPLVPSWSTLQTPILNLLVSIGASAILIMLIARFLPGKGPFRRLVLATSLPSGAPEDNTTRTTYTPVGSVGEIGIATNDLHPGGSARFGDRKLDVITRGEYIEQGTKIEIIEVEGNRIVVTPQKEQTS